MDKLAGCILMVAGAIIFLVTADNNLVAGYISGLLGGVGFFSMTTSRFLITCKPKDLQKTDRR